MKKMIFSALIPLFFAGIAHGYSQTISCSDPSLFKYFKTENEAIQGCPKYKNVYVTYDYGFKAYTCGCTNMDGDNN